MATVLIHRATYRNEPVENKIFSMVRPLDRMPQGKIQIRNDGQIPNAGKTIFIDVASSDDFEIIEPGRRRRAHDDHTENESMVMNMVTATKKNAHSNETDDQAMDRIKERFSMLEEMTDASINGGIRAMIVSGPPGVGKSYGVETQLEKASMFDRLAGNRVRYEVIKGAMTPIGLFCTLYKHSDRKNVLVFDDCDTVFNDELSLNILKAALDSGKRRRIYWNSDSAMLRREAVPSCFDFNGSVIFITNLDFNNVKSKKLEPHLEALQSRCHYLDLTISTDRDKMLRIRQVHRDADGGLFASYDFENGEGEEVLQYMQDNQSKLREVSLRMAGKIADLIKLSPTNWHALAKATVCRG